MSNDIEDWMSGFYNLNPDAVVVEVDKKSKEYKNDLFKDVIPALDRRDRKFYSRLNEEQQKDISIWLLTRWMSSVARNAAEQLYTVNQVINISSKYLNKHKEFQWMLLSITGTGKPEKHHWIAPPKGVKKNKVEEALLKWCPLLKDDEIDLILKINSRSDMEIFFRDNGMEDREIKELYKGT